MDLCVSVVGIGVGGFDRAPQGYAAAYQRCVLVVHHPDQPWCAHRRMRQDVGRPDIAFVVGSQSADVKARIEVAAQRNGCLALFEDEAIAVVVAVRAMSVLKTFSRDFGRARAAVVASIWSSTISAVLHALCAGEVITWIPGEAPAMSYPEVVASYDIVVSPTLREALYSPVPSHVVGYPREALDVCGSMVPPLIGTLCDSDATSVGIDTWAGVARAVLAMTDSDTGTDWDNSAMLIAAFVRRAPTAER